MENIIKIIKLNFKQYKLEFLGWVVIFTVVVATTPPLLKKTIADSGQWKMFIDASRSPVGIIFGGPGFGLNSTIPNLGAATVIKVIAMVCIALSVFNIFNVANLTRGIETNGQKEFMFGFGKILRILPSISGLLTVLIVDFIMCAFSSALFNIFNPNYFSKYDCFMFFISTFLYCIFFITITYFIAQFVDTARNVKFITLGLFIALFIVGSLATIKSDVGSFKSFGWVSPVIWIYDIKVFTGLTINFIPIFVILLFSIIFFVGGIFAETNRNYGYSLIKESNGRVNAGILLTSFFGLKLKLIKNQIIGWSVGLFILGAMYGSLIKTITNMVINVIKNQVLKSQNAHSANSSTAVLESIINNGVVSVRNIFIGLIIMLFSLVIGVFGLSLIRSLFATDEKQRRVDLFYAYPLSRLKVFISITLVGIIGVFCVTLAFSVGFGVFGHFSDSEVNIWSVILKGLSTVLISILFIAIAMCFTGINVSFSNFGWIYFVFCVLCNMFADSLHIPKWLQKCSVLYHFTDYPVKLTNIVPIIIVAAISAILTTVGYRFYKKRDI